MGLDFRNKPSEVCNADGGVEVVVDQGLNRRNVGFLLYWAILRGLRGR